MSNILLVTVPNNKENASTTFGGMVNDVDLRGGRISRFETPNLVVGTLDSLISLSDDLAKFGTQVEVSTTYTSCAVCLSTCLYLLIIHPLIFTVNFLFVPDICTYFIFVGRQNVVRKIERQYAEVSDAKTPALRVNDVAVDAYFKKFTWDFASYQFQGKQLAEIVGQIQAMAGKAEEELKLLTNNYTEKTLAVAAAKRRQVLNLTTSDFEDFLSPEKIAKLDVQNTEHLLTIMVVVPKALEQGVCLSLCVLMIMWFDYRADFFVLLLLLLSCRVHVIIQYDWREHCCFRWSRLDQFLVLGLE
jgi:hypothetical protein